MRFGMSEVDARSDYLLFAATTLRPAHDTTERHDLGCAKRRNTDG